MASEFLSIYKDSKEKCLKWERKDKKHIEVILKKEKGQPKLPLVVVHQVYNDL